MSEDDAPTGERDRSSTDAGGRSRLGRRRYLAAIGAGAAATAAAGLGAVGSTGAQQTGTPEGTPTGTEVPSEPGAEGPVRPAFGWPALSADVEPPVEPDHTVALLEQSREEGGEPEFFFDPVGLAVEPGDTVMFDSRSPFHTVSAVSEFFGYNQRIPEDAAPVDSPVLMSGSYFLYTFRVPGVYDLLCFPHEFLGMAFRVVVGEATGPGAEPIEIGPGGTPEVGTPEGETPMGTATPGADGTPAGTPGGAGEPELVPPGGASATVLADPAIDPERILEVGSVPWSEISDEAKTLPPEMGGEGPPPTTTAGDTPTSDG